MSTVRDLQILFIGCNENFCSGKIKLSSEHATNLTVYTIEKSYFFEEQFLLTFIKDMQHFFDHHSFHISHSSDKFCSIHIAKSTLTKPLFNLNSVTIETFMWAILSAEDCAFFKNRGSLKFRKMTFSTQGCM